MGVDLGDLVTRKKISLDDLSGRSIAIDAYNTLYQFLAIIRGSSGEPLMDRQGRITSHLSGIFYRTTNLIEKGIKPAYVFDGEPPELKEIEIQRRRQVKQEAVIKYELAIQKGEIAEAKRYAQMTSQLKDRMVEDAKILLDGMGVPWVQAPSEGEAQAAYMAARGDVWAAASQDYDSILFGAQRLVRNLAITGRRKLPRRQAYIEVEPELVELNDIFRELQLSREQLVDLGILIGTDFNPDGLKGIGPKTALGLIREHGKLEKVLASLETAQAENSFARIREIFLHPQVSSDFKLEWRSPNVQVVTDFLCRERDFSHERVKNALERITGIGGRKPEKPKTLESFFKT